MNNAINLVFGNSPNAHKMIEELDRFRGGDSRKKTLLIGLMMYADHAGDTELYYAVEEYLRGLRLGRPRLDLDKDVIGA